MSDTKSKIDALRESLEKSTRSIDAEDSSYENNSGTYLTVSRSGVVGDKWVRIKIDVDVSPLNGEAAKP